MIDAILNDAVRDGNIASWRPRRRLMFPDSWSVGFHDGDVIEYTRQGITTLCVNLAIYRGEIPDPASNEGSYPCG
jgi:hypothetical protein